MGARTEPSALGDTFLRAVFPMLILAAARSAALVSIRRGTRLEQEMPPCNSAGEIETQ